MPQANKVVDEIDAEKAAKAADPADAVTPSKVKHFALASVHNLSETTASALTAPLPCMVWTVCDLLFELCRT